MDLNLDDLFASMIKDFCGGKPVIKRLPPQLNPDYILDDAIVKKYGDTCPFCGSKGVQKVPASMTARRMRLGKSWEFWKPKHECHRREFKCLDCNITWCSPWYPQDLEKLFIDELHNVV